MCNYDHVNLFQLHRTEMALKIKNNNFSLIKYEIKIPLIRNVYQDDRLQVAVQ